MDPFHPADPVREIAPETVILALYLALRETEAERDRLRAEKRQLLAERSCRRGLVP